jgi:hypothetical protein
MSTTTTAVIAPNDKKIKKQIVTRETKSYVHFIAGG